MSEDWELDMGVGAQAFFYFLRSTKDCVQRCDVLKLDREFNDSEKECLQKCAVYHAGSTSTHMRFFHQYSEQVHLK